jgi:hypothetical protein
MFIWGSGHKKLQVPFNDSAPCPACKRASTRTAVIEYDYDHIFWLFKGLKNKIASVICGACGTQYGIAKGAQKTLYAKLGRNPIPFMDRFGAVVLIAIIVAWVALALAFPCFVNPTSQMCVAFKTVPR